jgi:hypothetical protein
VRIALKEFGFPPKREKVIMVLLDSRVNPSIDGEIKFSKKQKTALPIFWKGGFTIADFYRLVGAILPDRVHRALVDRVPDGLFFRRIRRLPNHDVMIARIAFVEKIRSNIAAHIAHNTTLVHVIFSHCIILPSLGN